MDARSTQLTFKEERKLAKDKSDLSLNFWWIRMEMGGDKWSLNQLLDTITPPRISLDFRALNLI